MTTKTTKKITIKLAALMRVEYMEIIEVPIDITDEQLEQLVDQRYDEVDGGEYTDDPEYWEQGNCSFEIADNSSKVTHVLNIGNDEIFTVYKLLEIEDQYHEILQHQVRITWREDNAPEELHESSLEYIEKMIKEGYREGELVTTWDDPDVEHRGWWAIDNQS
jgi:hypothetical protein